MEVAIIKYNAGNVRSVSFALERAGITPLISDDAELLLRADKIIFPGVGEAATAMKYLQEKNLDTLICSLKQPVLGICLGMQLLCSHSEEGDTRCLDIIPQRVKKMNATQAIAPGKMKIPQMGWNGIYNLGSPLFRKIPEQDYMYFVHGYYVEKTLHTIATTSYITEYSSAINKNNFYGVQFHPEKSGKAGQQIIENFLSL
jgi:glutamine amidotransferase